MAAQWRELFGGGENLRAYVGANTYDRAAVRRWMDSSQVGPRAGEATARDADVVLGYLDGWAAQGFKRWADFDLAEAWFRRAAELTTDAAERRVDGLPYVEQLNAVTEALRALANGYLALDLPWCVDPVFRGIVERSLLGVARDPCEQGEWARVFMPHAYVSSDGGRCVAIWERWHCGPYSTVDASHATAREAHADGTPSTTPWVHHYDQRGGTRVWWKSWAMYGECLRRMTAGACDDWQSWCLPPGFWWFKWVREASRDALVRGMTRVVADGLVFAQLKNAREALRLGVLGRVNAEQPSYEAATAVIAGFASYDLENARDMTQGDMYGRAREVMGIAGAVVGAATAGVGSVLFSILWGIGEIAMRVLPAAVNRVQDVWRRDQPVFERTTIAQRGPAERPSHDVPDPPGWVRPARASTGGSLTAQAYWGLQAPGAPGAGAASGVAVSGLVSLSPAAPGGAIEGVPGLSPLAPTVRPSAKTPGGKVPGSGVAPPAEGGGIVPWETPATGGKVAASTDAPAPPPPPPGPPASPSPTIPAASEKAPRRAAPRPR